MESLRCKKNLFHLSSKTTNITSLLIKFSDLLLKQEARLLIATDEINEVHIEWTLERMQE